LVLNGHDHNYQRSKPINLKVSSSAPVSKYGSLPGEGRCQIICGGAGAPLYSLNSSAADAWAMQKYQSTDNFVMCEINGCKMTITAYQKDGSILDQFTLDKTSNSSCTITDVVSSDIAVFNPIKVFPNPSSGVLTLNYESKNIGSGSVYMYDFTGKLVYSKNIVKSDKIYSEQFNFSNFSIGIYTLQVIIGEQSDNVVFVKE
jgi:hypothetical protein